MKQVIVLFAMVILGVAIYGIIAVGDDSIVGSVKEMWRHEIENKTREP